MRLLIPFILFILSVTIGAFPVRLKNRSVDGLSISISKRGSVLSSLGHGKYQPASDSAAQSCTEGPVQKAWRRALHDRHVGLPPNVYESTGFELRDGDGPYGMALIMVIEDGLTDDHINAIKAFKKLDMLLGLGHDSTNKQWFIVIKRVGDFAVYLDHQSEKLRQRLQELIEEEKRHLETLQVTVLETRPEFYTFWNVEEQNGRALPMFGAIGKYIGGSPPPFPEVEEFCSCDWHVHTTVPNSHYCIH